MRSKALVGTVEDRDSDTTDQDATGALNHHYDVAETRAPVRSVRRVLHVVYPTCILFGPATSLYILQWEHVDLPYSNRHVLLLEI